MGGPPFEEVPSAFGGTGAQFPSRFDDLDFSKLDINDNMGKIGVPQKSKASRRVLLSTTKAALMYCEYYSFTKGNT